MSEFFLRLLNMSLSACPLVLAAVLIRLLLKDAPKFIRCILWALVGIRLVCPFSIESIFSLLPSGSMIPENILSAPAASSVTAVPDAGTALAPGTFAPPAPSDSPGINIAEVILLAASIIWLAGLAAMTAYGMISFLRLKKRTAASIKLRDDIWICDDIDSPFILGILRARIYVPSSVTGQQLLCIEAHERAHLARRDHWWKPLGFAVLALHWFNPVIWLAYILLCRDIELACDERVIKKMDMSGKQEYSNALLSCSIPHRTIAACPLAFGEVGVRERVSSVLSYKKPTFWVIAAAVLACVIAAVCFMTNPVLDSELEAYLHNVILEEGRSSHTEEHFACEAHDILAVRKSGDRVTVYALVMYHEYSFENGVISQESGWHIPTVITIDTGGSAWSYEYWQSEDGTRYVPSIREKFPWYLENRAINIHRTAKRHQADCIRQAEEHYGTSYTGHYAGVEPETLPTTTTAHQDNAAAIPPISDFAKYSPEELSTMLTGRTSDELTAAWGEPFSHEAEIPRDIWDVTATNLYLGVYYDENGLVNHVEVVSSTPPSVLGTWRNITKNDLGTTMTFYAGYTGMTLFEGHEMPFTWSREGNRIDVMYAPSAHVYFREETNDRGMTTLVSDEDYYIMLREEYYDVRNVEIDSSNWRDYFELTARAELSGQGSDREASLVWVLRLRDEYAGRFIDADVAVEYITLAENTFAVSYDTLSGELTLNAMTPQELNDKKCVVLDETCRSHSTRFMDYNVGMLDGLELIGESSTRNLHISGTVAEWECRFCEGVEITNIHGTLFYLA